MVSFIDEHREAYGIEPICAEPLIAPSVYYEAKAQREKDPSRSPARVARDAELREVIERVWKEDFGVYERQGSFVPNTKGVAVWSRFVTSPLSEKMFFSTCSSRSPESG